METVKSTDPCGEPDTWEYRMIELVGTIFICEAYFDRKGCLGSYCHAEPQGETLEEVDTDLRAMLDATKKPIIQWIDPNDRT